MLCLAFPRKRVKVKFLVGIKTLDHAGCFNPHFINWA